MANDILFKVLNHANGQQIVYVGIATTLDFSLVNNMEGDITIQSGQSGAKPSQLEIRFPSFYAPADVQKMGFTLTDWTSTAKDKTLTLTYAGKNDATWSNGSTFAFSLTGANSAAEPKSENVTIKFINFKGNVPLSRQAGLALASPPKQGNIPLKDSLHVFLDNQGIIYASAKDDPLANSLILNFKNATDDSLYTGKEMWKVTPQVTAHFIYGSTSGALAPDDDPDKSTLGSAWNIKSSIPVDVTSGWQIQDPPKTGDNTPPVWTLNPANTNKPVLGAGAEANVTFRFDNIVALTPPGHTQMLVFCKGFRKDELTLYDDTLYVLDIVKQNAPLTRGLIHFFSPVSIATVNRPDQTVDIPLRWSMFGVNKVNLICSFPGVPPFSKTYGPPSSITTDDPALATDSTTITIPGTTHSVPVFLTLQAFSGNGGYLDSLQFTVFIDAQMLVDHGKVYPLIRVGKQFWLASNYDFDSGEGAYFYNKEGDNETPYGRLYTAKAAKDNAPPGWRLPTQSDWANLFKTFGEGQAAYAALIAGGSSGFEARAGGNRDDSGNYNDLAHYGYYWTSSEQDPSNIIYAGFNADNSNVTLGGTNSPAYAQSVRYVKDI